MTALITPVSDVAAALRVNHEKTEAAVVQVTSSLQQFEVLALESWHKGNNTLSLKSPAVDQESITPVGVFPFLGPVLSVALEQ